MEYTNNAGLKPVSASERIQTIDVLRGFALFGILLVNFAFFNASIFEAFSMNPAEMSSAEYAVSAVVAFFATGKFYPLFSFLFGLGFAVQLTRAEARGGPFKWTYTKRLLVLLVIGILHGALIWAGDILTLYAICGFFMLLLFMLKRAIEAPFKRADGTRRRLPLWVVLLVAAIFTLPGLGAMQWFAQIEQVRELQASGAELTERQKAIAETMEQQQSFFAEEKLEAARKAYGEGSWLEVTEQRVTDFGLMLSNVPFMMWFILTMFLIGGVFGRLNLIGRAAEKKKIFIGLLIVSLGIGVPLAWRYAEMHFHVDFTQPSREMGVAMVINQYAGLFMALSYVAAITLLMLTPAKKMLGLLAPVGRMALTNYLLQSFVSTFIFYGYGLAFFGSFNEVSGLVYCVIFFALQIPLSHWWMNRFAFGPVEWLWRTLTYGKRQPMRLANSQNPVTIA